MDSGQQLAGMTTGEVIPDICYRESILDCSFFLPQRFLFSKEPLPHEPAIRFTTQSKM
jgi:hypothetical protein